MKVDRGERTFDFLPTNTKDLLYLKKKNRCSNNIVYVIFDSDNKYMAQELYFQCLNYILTNFFNPRTCLNYNISKQIKKVY